jgi:hypothetical protein
MGHTAWAQEQFEAAIAIDSPAYAFFNLGKVLEAEGDSAQAFQYFYKAGLKDSTLFDMESFIMNIKMEKDRRIKAGDTAGMIFLNEKKTDD